MDYQLESPETPKYKRLQTFYASPLPNQNKLSLSNTPIKFAEAGFARKPTALHDEVECETCGIKFKGWSGESPLAVHRTLSPNCPFLNSPPTSVNGSTHTQRAHTKIRRQLFPDTFISTTFSAADFELPFFPKVGDNLMLFESHRLMTFSNVHSSESAMYARAGFILNKNTGKAVCVFCNVQIEFDISKSSHTSHLEIEHETQSPSCPFSQGFDLGNISRDDEAQIRNKVLEQQLSDKLNGKQSKCKYIIRHPEFEDKKCRQGTFITWPKLHASLFPSDLMVMAGFYYSGFMDKVQCFACGVSLYNWSPPADPARQHAKASPSCHFLMDTCGQDFIQAAQTDQLIVDVEHEEAPDQDAASSVTDSLIQSPSPPSSPAAATPSTAAASSPSVSPGSPTLDLEAVKAAMACGRYPNTGLLLGTLKAADENHIRLCEKSQEVAIKDSVIQAKDSQLQATRSELQAKDSVIQAKDSQLQAKDSELQRAAFELQWRNLEMRSELEQQFVGQIQQARESASVSVRPLVCLCVCPSTSLPLCLSVHLSASVSVRPLVCLCVCPSTCLPLCLSVHLSASVSVRPLVCLCVCPSTSLPLCLSVHLSASVSVRPLVCLCVCPSTCLPLCLSVH
ncbi:hypothetical protein RRG08_043218 [Elysia crispata]|uniref:Uncharacterized protein n=1 Tax=Elysia crispata TaxID=231223 RepID=A0AAE0ZIT4_9GAST|nr:hypothetical protein RRG08_043218 [Elysia crispata]